MSAKINNLEDSHRNTFKKATDSDDDGEEDGFYTPPEYPEDFEDRPEETTEQKKIILYGEDHTIPQTREKVVEILKPSSEGQPDNSVGWKTIMNKPDDAVNEITKDGDAKLPSGSDQSGMSISLIKERARALASRSEFYEACMLLEKVDEAQVIKDLGIKFVMVECYLKLGREKKANACLEYIQNVLTSRPHLDDDDLEELAADLAEEGSYSRAMIILKIIADIYLDSPESPDEILSGVYRCFDKLDDILTAILKQTDGSRTVDVDMGFENMIEIYNKIRTIQNCDRDQQVLKEARCCRQLDYNYSLLDDYRKCVHYATQGIKTMEDHFKGGESQRYQLYGLLLYNLAITQGNMRKFKQSLANHQKALQAKENALDYEDDSSKEAGIDEIKKSIKKTKSIMGII